MARPSDPTTKWKVDLSDFKASMQEAARQIKLANSEFKAATAGAEDWAKSTDGLTAKISSLKNIEEAQKRQLEALQAEYKRVSEAQGEDSKQAENLKIRINNQQAAVKTTQAELGKYEKALDNVGKETEETTAATEKATDGFSVMSGALAGIIAKGVTEGVKALANAFVDVAKAAVEAAKETAAYADEISTTAIKTGLSTETLQEFAYMAELVDVDLNTITGSMSKLLKTMITAQKGTGDAADAFKELGVQIVKHGELRDSREVFMELIDALGQVEDVTQRDALAMSIFGKSAQELNPLIAQGSDGIAEYAAEAHRVGAVLSSDALDGLNDTQDALDRFSGTWDALKRGLVSAVAPLINTVIVPLAEAFQSIAQGFAEGGIQGAFDKLIGLAQGIAQQAPQMLHGVLKAIPTVISAILGAIPQLIKAGFEIVKGFVAEFPAYALEIAQGVPIIVQALKDELIGEKVETLKGFKELIEVFTDAVADFLQEPGLPDAITDIVQMITETLLTLTPELIEAATDFFVAIIDAIPIILPALAEAMPQIAVAIVNGLIKSTPAILKAAEAMFWAVVDAVDLTAKAIIRALPSIPQAIAKYFESADALGTAGGAMAGYGRQLIAKLWEGIQSLKSWLQERVSSLMMDVIATLTGPLGSLAQPVANALNLGAQGVAAATGTGTAGANALTGSTGVTFNQIINSPKSLSASEIYQATNSLLFSASVAR